MPEPKTKIINGVSFLVSQPYTEGHVLNAAEAKTLNQTRSENIGNNVRKKLTEMAEANEPAAALAAYVAEVDAAYEFTLATAGSARVVDPYEREALRLAKDLLKEELAKTGRKLSVAPDGVTKEEWEEKVEAKIAQIASNEKVLAAAKKTVDAKKKTSASLLEALGDITG